MSRSLQHLARRERMWTKCVHFENEHTKGLQRGNHCIITIKTNSEKDSKHAATVWSLEHKCENFEHYYRMDSRVRVSEVSGGDCTADRP